MYEETSVTKKKKLPKPLKNFLELLGFIMGLCIGVIEFVIGLFAQNIIFACLLWALTIVGSLVALQLIQWRHFDLLKEWGLLGEKKEEKKQ